jgi:DNA polymerase-3 subunit epsilon
MNPLAIYTRQLIADGALILDTETTGLTAEDEIVEIAIVNCAGDLLYNQMVKPSQPIPPEVTAIHGITDGEVENCPTWPDVWPLVKDWISGRTVIAYNAVFDRDMLSNSCGKYPEQIEGAYLAPIGLKTRWVDLMTLWMTHIGTSRRMSLARACDHAGIEPGKHRAWSDAEAARQLLIYLSEVKDV